MTSAASLQACDGFLLLQMIDRVVYEEVPALDALEAEART